MPRVTAIEYYFETPEEAFRTARSEKVTGKVRLNLRNGVVCGGACLETLRTLSDSDAPPPPSQPAESASS